MASTYNIRTLVRSEIDQAVDWAAAEGWNPGLGDAECFASVDPDGFMGGFLDGQMIASISVVNYDAQFSFLGFYIVTEPYRGRGYGLHLWHQAIRHAGDRLLGLDGVVAEQHSYCRSGFVLAYRNVRYGGAAPAGFTAHRGEGVEIITLDQLDDELVGFDRMVFPAERNRFLQRWLTAPGHIARAARVNGAFAGYGVLRPCRSGYKIGPLFAADPTVARLLVAELLSALDGGPSSIEIYLDVPEPNAEAMALAETMGLSPVFETARMYTGPSPHVTLERVFGVSSFELG